MNTTKDTAMTSNRQPAKAGFFSSQQKSLVIVPLLAEGYALMTVPLVAEALGGLGVNGVSPETRARRDVTMSQGYR